MVGLFRSRNEAYKPHCDHARQMPRPLHYGRRVTEYIIDLGQHDENYEEE